MINLLWLQSSGCGGCTMSLLNAESPDLLASLEAAGVNLLWHPSLSEQSGSEVRALLQELVDGEQRLDVLCLEGAVVCGPNGSGRFHVLAGTGVPMMAWVERLAARARYVVAVGSCASYGGVSSAGTNPAEVRGLQYDGEQRGGLLGGDYRSGAGAEVINVAGCPPHPNWITETLMGLSLEELDNRQLDPLGRPRFYADHLVHHGCPRNEFYEYKASARQASDNGCLMEHMGCIGTQAHGDCNIRLWNGQGSCTRGGFACINCTAPEFEEPGHPFVETPKLAGIPVGLPTDMPKAWFVALSSLSKAATPERLKENAVSDHIKVAPKIHTRKKR
ncbi:HupU protein [Motiliproteus sp. SC1-56]|uniref:NADH-quinone oxidoreductase subunit B family protein n=1 Tax=Motiliproteus sp. SC1-56 TaxID=2799565 RepID=UPI001F5CA918|nr:HupU protein [Motiliproteus sp. SC1-56]